MQITYDFDNISSVRRYEEETDHLDLIDVLDYYLCADGRYFIIELWSDSNVRAYRTEYCPDQQLPTRTIDDDFNFTPAEKAEYELLHPDPNYVQEYPDEDLPF